MSNQKSNWSGTLHGKQTQTNRHWFRRVLLQFRSGGWQHQQMALPRCQKATIRRNGLCHVHILPALAQRLGAAWEHGGDVQERSAIKKFWGIWMEVSHESLKPCAATAIFHKTIISPCVVLWGKVRDFYCWHASFSIALYISDKIHCDKIHACMLHGYFHHCQLQWLRGHPLKTSQNLCELFQDVTDGWNPISLGLGSQLSLSFELWKATLKRHLWEGWGGPKTNCPDQQLPHRWAIGGRMVLRQSAGATGQWMKITRWNWNCGSESPLPCQTRNFKYIVEVQTFKHWNHPFHTSSGSKKRSLALWLLCDMWFQIPWIMSHYKLALVSRLMAVLSIIYFSIYQLA